MSWKNSEEIVGELAIAIIEEAWPHEDDSYDYSPFADALVPVILGLLADLPNPHVLERLLICFWEKGHVDWKDYEAAVQRVLAENEGRLRYIARQH